MGVGSGVKGLNRPFGAWPTTPLPTLFLTSGTIAIAKNENNIENNQTTLLLSS